MIRNVSALLLALAVTTPAQVLTGVDRLERDGFAILRGMRVGLITNHTGRTNDGRSTVDAFASTDACDLVALFSPEHGFAGKLDQAIVEDAAHGGTGLVIHSLYGKTRVPTAEMLTGLDALVFDIQDIGTRFYTYISTMKGAMVAAAEHGVRFVVLDRPNPIGADWISGPVLDEGSQSFVGCHTLPVRHGMTVGELARMLRAELRLELELEVVRCEGWSRATTFDRTGLTWIDPSPNIRCLDQAILYPGVGLLETTNLSVGRGTDTPFERIGAPWLDAQSLARRLNREVSGATFTPIEFAPDSSKFAGVPCRGVQISITDRAVLRPVALGIRIACALRDLHPDEWDSTRIPRLLCDRATFEALREGLPAEKVMAGWPAELEAFEQRRAKFRIYD
ncbi:MAG: DUF1343 domain-containing protein [Planctomycetes bacterium]|nr:DUF1343 domain-containing protein [Planctomycetota bacterium]